MKRRAFLTLLSLPSIALAATDKPMYFYMRSLDVTIDRVTGYPMVNLVVNHSDIIVNDAVVYVDSIGIVANNIIQGLDSAIENSESIAERLLVNLRRGLELRNIDTTRLDKDVGTELHGQLRGALIDCRNNQREFK